MVIPSPLWARVRLGRPPAQLGPNGVVALGPANGIVRVFDRPAGGRLDAAEDLEVRTARFAVLATGRESQEQRRNEDDLTFHGATHHLCGGCLGLR